MPDRARKMQKNAASRKRVVHRQVCAVRQSGTWLRQSLVHTQLSTGSTNTMDNEGDKGRQGSMGRPGEGEGRLPRLSTVPLAGAARRRCPCPCVQTLPHVALLLMFPGRRFRGVGVAAAGHARAAVDAAAASDAAQRGRIAHLGQNVKCGRCLVVVRFSLRGLSSRYGRGHAKAPQLEGCGAFGE